jgi:hypothetical protein
LRDQERRAAEVKERKQKRKQQSDERKNEVEQEKENKEARQQNRRGDKQMVDEERIEILRREEEVRRRIDTDPFAVRFLFVYCFHRTLDSTDSARLIDLERGITLPQQALKMPNDVLRLNQFKQRVRFPFGSNSGIDFTSPNRSVQSKPEPV